MTHARLRLLPRDPQHGRDHREDELARAGLGAGVQEVAHLGQQPGTSGLLHDQEAGVRREGGQQGVRSPPLPVLELPDLGRLEQVGPGRGQPLLAGLRGRGPPPQQRDVRLALADLGQRRDPADPVVIDVPQRGERAARGEDPGDLPDGPVQVELVHGLSDQDGVHARVG